MKLKPVFLSLLPLLAWASASARADSMTLEQTLAEAYRNNPSLEAERAKLRATDEQVSLAQSHWMPNIAATGNVGKTYQYLPADAQFGTANYDAVTHSLGLQVTQPLFRGFRTQSEMEAAEKQVKAGRAQLQTAEEQLLLDTSTAFLDTIRDQTILDYDRENERVLADKLKETSARAGVGDLTQTDIRQAESRLARAQAGTLQAQNTLSTDKETFQRLVGFEPPTLTPSDVSLPPTLQRDEAVKLAEKENPNVLAADFAVQAADADIDSNKGSLLPELDLVGNSSRSYGESVTTPGRYDSSQVLLQLTIPLFPTGADYAKVRAAQQTSVQHRMERDNAVRRAHENAHNSWDSFTTNDTMVKADQREIDAAADALKGVRVQSHAGTRTTLDVLNAEQELLDAKTDLAKSLHDRNLAIVQVKAAMGQLTADALNLQVDNYDPQTHYNDTRTRFIGFDDADEDIYIKPSRVVTANPNASDSILSPSEHPLKMPPDAMLIVPPGDKTSATEVTGVVIDHPSDIDHPNDNASASLTVPPVNDLKQAMPSPDTSQARTPELAPVDVTSSVIATSFDAGPAVPAVIIPPSAAPVSDVERQTDISPSKLSEPTRDLRSPQHMSSQGPSLETNSSSSDQRLQGFSTEHLVVPPTGIYVPTSNYEPLDTENIPHLVIGGGLGPLPDPLMNGAVAAPDTSPVETRTEPKAEVLPEPLADTVVAPATTAPEAVLAGNDTEPAISSNEAIPPGPATLTKPDVIPMPVLDSRVVISTGVIIVPTDQSALASLESSSPAPKVTTDGDPVPPSTSAIVPGAIPATLSSEVAPISLPTVPASENVGAPNVESKDIAPSLNDKLSPTSVSMGDNIQSPSPTGLQDKRSTSGEEEK